MIIRFKVLTIIKKLNQLQLYKDTYTFTVDDTISTIRHKNTMILGSNKEERYSRVPRLSDTRYSANGTKGKWR